MSANRNTTGRGEAARGCAAERGAFTLIEMLVVVTILILLIAILLPALAAARRQAYVTGTTAELQSLRSACEQYFQTFGSYPGLFAEKDIANNTSLSGSQNLYLSLIGAAISPSSGNSELVTLARSAALTSQLTQITETGVQLTVGTDSTYYVSGTAGPNDLTQVNGSPNANQFPAFYQVRNGETGFVTASPTAGYASTVPAFIDHFPDGLPILYYRRITGVSQPVVAPASGAAYYSSCNAEYTAATSITSTGGSPFVETSYTGGNGTAYVSFANTALLPANSSGSPPPPATLTNLQQAVTNQNYLNQTVAVGGFVLIAAGPSRYYGATAPSGSSTEQTTDNIVVVGGQ